MDGANCWFFHEGLVPAPLLPSVGHDCAGWLGGRQLLPAGLLPRCHWTATRRSAEQNGKSAELQQELEALVERQNQSKAAGATSIPATFLRVTVTR